MILIIFSNIFLVSVCVLIHFEMLLMLSKIIPKLSVLHRLRIVFGIFGSLCAHVVEVWIFALGYYVLIQSGHYGELNGEFHGTLLDCVYFSFTTYTSLGLGDIYPTGPLRFLVGIESLTGLALITWTASFMFLEMQKFWNSKH